MKIIAFFVISGFLLTLAACGKSDVEKLVDESAANSKKQVGKLEDIPRIRITPDKKKEGEK